MTQSVPPRTPHLSSAILASLIIAIVVCSGRLWAVHLERRTVYTTAPDDFFIKNQGLAFQDAAARASDVLLMYGSSELIDPVQNRSPEFFKSAPTGFEVCPVGKPGATSLIMLQKIAAIGKDLRDRKIAISISPSFFFRPDINPAAYAGNFSLPAASGLVFGNVLDSALKHEIAQRMLKFPDTLEKSALLETAVQFLASDRPVDRAAYAVIWPLGKLQNAVFDFQDHFEALVYILSGGKKISRKEIRELLDSPEGDDRLGRDKGVGNIGRRGEEKFLARITGTTEWTDMELLFRTLNSIGARPLVLSMPLDGTAYDQEGVSREARQVYYDRLKDLAARYAVPIIPFEDHDSDPSFQIPRREHPTEQGWNFYNAALDNFFHRSDEQQIAQTWQK